MSKSTKIRNGFVARVPTQSSGQALADSSVGTAQIQDLAVTEAKLLNPNMGRLIGAYYYTTSTVYNKNPNAKYVRVRVIGGGGGSGGVAATSVGEAACSGGGGGGGYTEKIVQNTLLAPTETVTVGAGGTAGASGANNGGTGGTSSFGAHCSASGGVGGDGGNTTAGNSGSGAGVGGAGSGGDLNIPGGGGGVGRTNGGLPWIHNYGGSTAMTPGAAPIHYSNVGRVGPSYGSGASGSSNLPSLAAKTGAAGGAGIVIVEEYG